MGWHRQRKTEEKNKRETRWSLILPSFDWLENGRYRLFSASSLELLPVSATIVHCFPAIGHFLIFSFFLRSFTYFGTFERWKKNVEFCFFVCRFFCVSFFLRRFAVDGDPLECHETDAEASEMPGIPETHLGVADIGGICDWMSSQYWKKKSSSRWTGVKPIGPQRRFSTGSVDEMKQKIYIYI